MSSHGKAAHAARATLCRAAALCALLLPGPAVAQVADSLRAVPTFPTYDAASSLATPAPLTAGAEGEAPRKNFWRAAGGVVLVNVGLNVFHRLKGSYNIVEGDTVYWAESNWNTIKTNFREGFEWDDNNFVANQFAHPYHGNLYYNSARANGYNFWESAPFAIAGSFTWEYAGELYRPAFNDWINTSLGGIALGEMTWRVSSLILDNEATGFSRFLHEAGGFLVNPMRGFNRLVTGEIHRVGPNPAERRPSKLGAIGSLGYRRIGTNGTLGDGATDHAFLQLGLRYGNRFDERNRKPFDYFYVEVQLNTRDSAPIGEVRVDGLLTSTKLGGSDSSRFMLGLFNHFDYFNNLAYRLGGVNFGVALLYDKVWPSNWRLSLGPTAGVLPLGAISSEYGVVVNREYDYGPGLTGRFEALVRHRDFEVAGIDAELYYVHTMNGPPVKHLAQYYRAFAGYPVLGRVSVGADATVFKRRTWLNEEFMGVPFPTFTSNSPQVRVFASLLLAGQY